jgi:hypothetical protein
VAELAASILVPGDRRKRKGMGQLDPTNVARLTFVDVQRALSDMRKRDGRR